MTNLIGPVSVPDINAYSKSGNKIKIRGTCTTEANLQQVRELFRLAPGNIAIAELIGGPEVAYDLTDDSVLTQYCIWDSAKQKAGWYALISFSEEANASLLVWPFTAELFWLGTDAELIRGLDIFRLDPLTNDWSL